MTVQTTAGERLERTLFFGSAEIQGAGRTLSGVNLTCIFGSARLDLRSTDLAGTEVRLEALLLFASVELRVPASWRVITDVQPLFGNIEERGVAPSVPTDAPTLRITGTVMFANLELGRF